MNRIIFGAVSLFVLSSLMTAQEHFQSDCIHSPGVHDYYAWFRSTSLSAGRSYRVSSTKLDALRNAYPKLELGIFRSEARMIFGTPDFEQLVPEAIMGVPTSRCEYQWAYILRKDTANMVDQNDVAIYLSFSNKGRLIWKSPQNLDLKPQGSPTGK